MCGETQEAARRQHRTHAPVDWRLCPLASPAAADEQPCIHIRAAAKHAGFTHALRRQAAEYLAASGQMTIDKEMGFCNAPLLAATTKAAYCRPFEGTCTCHDRALHGICCHLMAAALLPGEQRMELMLAVELAAPAPAAEMQVGPVGRKHRRQRAWRAEA